jgi:hypothetical protein
MTAGRPAAGSLRRFSRLPKRLHPLALALVLIPILYVLTLARGLVLGDPTEYTFVAATLGIAHPPGYAFITVLGKLFQTLVPIGDIPTRMHLLSAVAATLAAVFVFGTVNTVGRSLSIRYGTGAAIFAALTVALGTDFWQHSIHANPHIITATFLATNLFFLTRWWAGQGASGGSQEADSKGKQGDDNAANSPFHPITRSPHHSPNRWLYAFCLSAGLGVTHHPLTIFSFLAYGLFIVWVRPRIWRDWRLLLKMAAFALLGLSVWLYLPIRSAMQPSFGPGNMNTLDGFLNHVLARGISESLPFFGLVDQPDRALVFWTLLRVQYTLPIIFMALVGLVWLVWDGGRRRRGEGETQGHRDAETEAQGHGDDESSNSLKLAPVSLHPLTRSTRPLGLLYSLALLSNYLFVINLRQQDVMAYLLGAFLLIGLSAGIGVLALFDVLERRVRLERTAAALLLAAFFLLGPALQALRNLPAISLADYDEGQAYIEEVFERFAGSSEGAVLLNDWEHMTPLWYSQFVEKRWPDETDVRPRLVSTDRPWVESVYDFLPGGPVYLSGYRPEIVDAGFRLRPSGLFYQVVEPGDNSIPADLKQATSMRAGEVEIVAYGLPQRSVSAGDLVSLTLAMRSPEGTDAYYVPVILVGETADQLVYEFTTDSHLTTPMWLANEVIVDRFDFALPLGLPTGDYPLAIGLRNLSTGQDSDVVLPIGELTVEGQTHPLPTGRLLANFRQRVGLASATARNALAGRRTAPWNVPLLAKPGDTIHLTLEWQSLAPAEESYTVFVHLIDAANQPIVTLDYTPLGGSTPTHLWIPKWLPGQKMLDPYRLEIPASLAPGTYFIETGLYEMTAGRRLHMADAEGNLIGDRYILGPIQVEE